MKWGQCPPAHSTEAVSSSAVDFPFLMQRNWNFSSCREGPGGGDLYLKIACHKKKKVGWREGEDEKGGGRANMPTHSEREREDVA